MKFKKSTIIVLFIILLAFILAFLFIKDFGPIIDELSRYTQIQDYMAGEFILHPWIAVSPVYALFFAALGSILNVSSPVAMRFLSTIFSFFSVIVFFLLAKKISKENPLEKTLQYVFLPILFPLFFLLYTDAFSLLFVLLALFFLFRKEYDLAGLFGIFSFFIRQMNIVWLGFMAIWVWYEEYKFKFDKETIKNCLKDCWVYIAGFILFLVFIILNKGIALGDRSMHPAFSFNLGNIFFMLFAFFFLFLPLNIANFPKILEFIKKHWKRALILTIIIFLVYMFGFVNTHPFNTFWDLERLRNNVLLFMTSSLYMKALFFIPIAYSIFSIAVTKLQRKSFYLMYVFALLVLLPSWFITWRYYLIPFTLFILFRKKESKLVEYSTIAYYILLLALVFYGLSYGMYAFV